MSWPCWFRIVMDPELQRGPTIPFVLGACRDPLSADAEPKLGDSNLERLLAAMRDETPGPYCIEILRCPDLKAYVASARTEPPEGRVRIVSPRDQSRVLYSCDKIDDHEVRDFQTLTEALWTTRGNDIVNGRFSRRGGKWRHFEREDLDNITALRNDPSPAVPSRLKPPPPIG